MSNRLQLNLEHGTNIACAPFAMISTQRGFRQATRGPDTGAFHHPLFRRDQPHLCLDMVCQRSRNSSKQPKNKQMSGNLSIAPLTKESLDTILPSAASQQTQPPNSRVATVSVSDDTAPVIRVQQRAAMWPALRPSSTESLRTRVLSKRY